MDIVVTTPKSEMLNAAAEAAQCLRDEGGYYFRAFQRLPTNVQSGCRVYYVENGAVRGFALVERIEAGRFKCETTGRCWSGWNLLMRADSWKWIEPIPMRGFQGWRYWDGPAQPKVIGGWKEPKP